MTPRQPADKEKITSVDWKHSTWKNYIVAAVGEFLGTLLFLFFSFAGVQCVKLGFQPIKSDQSNPFAAPPTPDVLLYIAIVFGSSLAANVWVFYRISGGLFNPAVTLGVMVLRGMGIGKGLILIVSQLLGGIAAAGLVDAIFPGPLACETILGGGMSVVQGLFMEALLTFMLTLTIYMLAFEKHRATYLAPIGIGLALFIAHLAGVLFTGPSVNPARSFGPAVITRNFPSYHWIFWLGPAMGSIAASGFYKVLLVIEYNTANPMQDEDGITRYAFAVGARAEKHRMKRERASQTGTGVAQSQERLNRPKLPGASSSMPPPSLARGTEEEEGVLSPAPVGEQMV